MSSPIDTPPVRACLRLKALLRDQAQALPLPARRLRELTATRDGGGARRALVEDAALVLSELVDRASSATRAPTRSGSRSPAHSTGSAAPPPGACIA